MTKTYVKKNEIGVNFMSNRKTDTSSIPDYEVLFSSEENKKSKGSGFLKKLLKKNWYKLIISSVLYTIKACPNWIIPILTANIITLATNQTDGALNAMIMNTIVLFAVSLQNIPTHMLYARYTDKMLRTIGAGLRSTLIRKLQHLSVTYHKEMESGKIQSKFLRDVEAVEMLNNRFVKNVIPAVIGALISIGISISKSGAVTLFFLFVIPVNVGLVYAFRKKMRKTNSQFRSETESISAKLTTMLEMIPVTKAHGLEEEEIASLDENIKELTKKGLVVDKANAYFASTSWVLSKLLSGICLLFTGYLAIIGKIGVGDIVLYQTYFNIISGDIQALINIYPEITKGMESLRSVSEIMLSDDIEDNKGKIKLRYVHGTVHFDDVSYRYPNTDKDVIKDFTLHVKEGECIAFVGASGSGKSTIMNMIIGFLKSTKGTISIDGKPMEMLNLSDYRHFISVVPQNSILFTGTIKDNITYGMPNVSKKRLEEAIEMANINEFVKDMPKGINTMIGEHGGKLSGGQKQRISIARALIRDPRILILDEATSALDNISEYHVQKAISELIKGRTTFIVAHRLSTIRDADRIVVMDEGRCVEVGTFDELMAKKGKFYELKTLNDMGKSIDEAMGVRS
ncbi:MAG: ABC transporter ATP-binding protein [Ruminococcaceae bacterium]|nr:ABC transporter ATP-binding protein [Oscillospiraceae bacterium]